MDDKLTQTSSVRRKSAKSAALKKGIPREDIKLQTRVVLLTESGYRCAVPTCREILLIDLHHIWEVSQGGGNDVSNLIALCPTCHARYHRGQYRVESIYAWKAMLISIGRAFDVHTIDRLMFLNSLDQDFLIVSGDGLLHFDHVLAAGLAIAELKANNQFQLVSYSINITEKGKMLVSAWQTGDLNQIQSALHPELTLEEKRQGLHQPPADQV